MIVANTCESVLPMSPALSRKYPAMQWLKLFIGVAILAFLLLSHDNAAQIVRLFRNLDGSSVLILVLISVVTNLTSSIKWRLFLAGIERPVSQWRLFTLYLMGKFFNNFLPSMMGGDIARILILGRDIGSHSRSAASVVMERATGMVGLVLLVLFSAAINPKMLGDSSISIPILLAVAGCSVMLLAYFSRGFSEFLLSVCRTLPVLRRFAPKIGRFLDAFFQYRGSRRLLALSLLLSVCFHFFACVNVYAACRAIGFYPAFPDVMVITPVVLLVTAIPVSPRSIGWWEWCFSVFLAGAGGSAAQGVAVALTLRVVALAMSLLGGVFFLCDRSAVSSPAAAASAQKLELDSAQCSTGND